MLSFLPKPLLGVLTLLLGAINIFFWSFPVLIMTFIRVIVPVKRFRQRCTELAEGCVTGWTDVNLFLIRLTQKTEWEIVLPEALRRDGSYVVISNHQSWMDIVVVLGALSRRIPVLKFLMKHELIWIPFIGPACWALNFPFMKRHSQKYLLRHPERRGEDLATLRAACQRYLGRPTSVMNFIEGTRATAEMHAKQRSRYRYLLRPKPGGLTYLLSAMGEQLDGIIDVTICYPERDPNMWTFASGGWPRIAVHATVHPIPTSFARGDVSDPAYREAAHAWLRQIWTEKDELLAELRQEAGITDEPQRAA